MAIDYYNQNMVPINNMNPTTIITDSNTGANTSLSYNNMNPRPRKHLVQVYTG
uniref:Uncharacterized protein n=1 Tax=Arundo donax TaxID=35708 RepID=A0A0A9E4U4_ARUDO